MSDKHKNLLVVTLAALMLLSFSLWAWLKTPDKSSDSERRLLAQFPALEYEKILTGRWAKDFESFTSDQFPMREFFRSIKAFSTYNLMLQKDNHNIYSIDGYLSKIEYPLKHDMLEGAAKKFASIYEAHLKGTNVYFSIIPDKNYFLAQSNGYLSMDYDAFIEEMRTKAPFMKYIDIKSALSIQNFYRTDAHWSQETLEPIAKLLGNAMGVQLDASYTLKQLETPLRGVYSGQYALPTKPDPIRYLDSTHFPSCNVTNYDTGKPVPIGIYSFEKAKGEDAYDFFLSGASSLITIENSNASSDKELIIFRDSFGSSIAPLLVPGYKKITLVDLRYLPAKFLSKFITFKDQDVLFLYSTTLLNTSNILK